MNVKIDTKEKFSVFTPQNPLFSANMTEELENLLLGQMEKPVPHVVLDLENVENIEDAVAKKIATIQQQFYENGKSFVICCMKDNVKSVFDTLDLLDVMNVTPTQSEAWDILQMEEVERELLGGFED